MTERVTLSLTVDADCTTCGGIGQVDYSVSSEGQMVDIWTLCPCVEADAPTSEPIARNMKEIQRAVCEHFGMVGLQSASRNAATVLARQVSMYLCRARSISSLREIGEAHGGRHHTTVMSAVARIEDLIEQGDERVIAAVQAVETVLEAMSEAS